MNDQRPSKKQRELLSFIDGFIKGNGYGPSYREIMRGLSYKSVSTVAVHVDGLIARGWLVKRDHSARSLEVIHQEATSATTQITDVKPETWLVERVKTMLEKYEQTGYEAMGTDAALLVESLRILGLKTDHATLRERLDSYQKKQ
jgi:SOS-response transcriptional repressor LexA